MADIDLIKRNIDKMLKAGAPDREVDEYLSDEGVTVDQLQSPASDDKLEDLTPFPQPASPSITLRQRAEEIFGLDPTLKRATLLPFAKNIEGEAEFAIPQIGVDMMKGAILPGHVAQGGEYDLQDASRMALDFNPMASKLRSRAITKQPLTKKAFVKEAPGRAAIKKQSGALFKTARARGVAVKPDKHLDMLTKLSDDINVFGTSKTLHPKATGVLDEWVSKLGDDVTFDQIQIMRREALAVTKSAEPSEVAIGGMMMDALDNLVDNLKPDDLASGDSLGLGAIAKRARNLWSRQRKMETIDKLYKKAGRAGSGLENGLRQEFRSLLNNEKKVRWFTKAERNAMEKVVKGGPVRSALRMFSHFGPPAGGSNRMLGTTIGGSLGAVGGSAAGGPIGAGIGAAGVMTAGHLAGRGAQASTKRAADMVRAMSARGTSLSGGAATKAAAAAARNLALRRGSGWLAGRQAGPNGGVMIDGEEFF